MVNAVKNNLDAIRDACKKHRVESLYIFGSAARELDFAEKSDIDFLYRFKSAELNELDYADNFFGLKFTLETITGRNVDLISIDHLTNPF